jgi:hypothetical protein
MLARVGTALSQLFKPWVDAQKVEKSRNSGDALREGSREGVETPETHPPEPMPPAIQPVTAGLALVSSRGTLGERLLGAKILGGADRFLGFLQMLKKSRERTRGARLPGLRAYRTQQANSRRAVKFRQGAMIDRKVS